MAAPPPTLRQAMTDAADPLLSALAALANALEASGTPSMVIGGIAVIAHGVARQTIDIDATIAAARTSIKDLVELFAKYDIHPRIDDAIRFAQERQVLLLIHRPSNVPLDVTLAWLPFEEEALARARPMDFGGVSISVVSPGDLIVYKAIAWRERDRTDIERLLIARYDELDLDAIRARVREFAAVIDDPERPQQLDALIQRVARLSS
jgi:predicted nucleotidyltransferase